MRRGIIGLGLVLTLGFVGAARAAEGPAGKTIDLWPGAAPGENGTIGEEKATKSKDGATVTSITNVTKPTLTICRPEASKNAGVAIVVAPGGGYNNLAWDHEGEQVARWLNSLGVTAAILKYRVPRRPDTPQGQPPRQALMDAQRALSLVRSQAADLGVDPKKIGMLGFSAGGHLTAWAATNGDRREYPAADDADKAECKPDFAVVIYPGGMIKRGTEELTSDIKVTSQSPPMFIAQSHDDRVNPVNSVALYLALKRADVPAELHIYSTGGHGYGLRASGKPSATWIHRCDEWMREQGILKGARKD